MLRILLISVFFNLCYSSIKFADKSYKCVNGSCQLNDAGVSGLAHGVCLISCGAGNLWPMPTGKKEISSQFIPLNFANVEITGLQKNAPLFLNMKEHFFSTIKSINQPNSQLSSAFTARISIVIIVEQDDVLIPSIKNDESYSLTIMTPTSNFPTSRKNEVKVIILGGTLFGVRHGLETLSQLITYDYFSNSLVMPAKVQITDKPVFPYRGVMIDVARNFISVGKLKETIRAMGYNKMNVLHLHISDSGAFPLEITSQPNITAYGAYDNERYYSVEDVRDLVSYAHAHGVQIIPEIDAPAHMAAGWQWGKGAGLGDLVLCTDTLGAHSDQWTHEALGPAPGQLNLANMNIYPLLETVYNEVIGLFQSDMYHVGGDEVLVGSDESSISCYNNSIYAASMLNTLAAAGYDRKNLQTFYDMWIDFTHKVTLLIEKIYQKSTFVSEKASLTEKLNIPLNKIVIWGGSGDDTTGVKLNLMYQPELELFMPPDLYTIEVWDTTDGSLTSTLLDKGYDVILANSDYVYLDCGNAGWAHAGGYWCQPYHEWYHIYEYVRDVTKKWNLNKDQLSRVKGSETLMWTEMTDDINLSQKVWPRSAALAEALWSNSPFDDKKTWFAAAGRMLHWRDVMVARGIQAEALQPHWCAQRDAYACTVNSGNTQ